MGLLDSTPLRSVSFAVDLGRSASSRAPSSLGQNSTQQTVRIGVNSLSPSLHAILHQRAAHSDPINHLPSLIESPRGGSLMNANVREFFDCYEQANAEFEVPKIAAFYADIFMFGGPQGVQCVKKEDFVRVLPKRKEFFRSGGLVSSKIESLEASNLDSKYVMVKAVWKMHFESRTGLTTDSENSATYILAGTDNSFQIVVQLDHQDLMKKVQDLGLK
jgi:hypothetical protein